ncbi:MAG: hypothetical protein M1816_007026 [Peltula sp. TS41687]|nr:MAG: hypothetical protein M1816_007026 [Peltula sp. TS41687]
MSPTGHLYAFGSNNSGQLGLRHHEDVSIPTRCLLPDLPGWDTPLKVAAGGNHTLVLFASGSVYAAGENKDGRCCASPSNGFHRVSFSSSDETPVNTFKLCSATWEASVFVTSEDAIYTCGIGTKGELGLGTDVAVANLPRRIEDFPPPGRTIVDLASSMWHTIVVLSDGDVYGWGHGRRGQLGSPAGIISSPRKLEIEISFKALRATCGREFTHVVGDFSTGEHAILGSEKWQIKSTAPEKIPNWKDIGASWGSIYVLFSDHTLLSWGRNDHGQLAPTNLPPIRSIAVGSEHALAITIDLKLIAWGWGEHGNCGAETDDAGDVKGCWKLIPTCRESLMTGLTLNFIGAGCATSLVWI